MNPLEQYITLYEQQSQAIDEGAAPVLNRLRPSAYETLQEARLPEQGSEDYEITNLYDMLSPDYGLNIMRRNLGADPALSFKCGVPNMSTCMFLVLDDISARTQTFERALPEGVLAGSLRRMALEHPDIVARHYGSIADMNNPLTALNTLLCQDGFFLYVPSGVKIEKTIQIVNIFQAAVPLMAVRRMLIILEDDAEASLLVCDHTQNDKTAYLSLQSIEIIVGKNSRFDFYDMEESSRLTSRLSSLYLSQEENSNVLIDGITLYNGATRNGFYCDFQGENAELTLLGMGIEDEDRSVTSHSIVRHNKPRCHTEELIKYVAQDSSRAAFSGRIYVAPGAVGTRAYQNNRNIVDSAEARVYSKPQLEIYNDDVKCSHGTAIGQLDEMQLFYMRTRGLSESTARQLLKQAFMADVIEGIRLPMLRDRLHTMVEQRFAGYRPTCAECSDSCLPNRQI